MSTKLVGLSIAAIAIAIVAIFTASFSIMDEAEGSINSYNPQTRDIYLFSQVDENIDEDKFGIPPDHIYSVCSI